MRNWKVTTSQKKLESQYVSFNEELKALFDWVKHYFPCFVSFNEELKDSFIYRIHTTIYRMYPLMRNWKSLSF